MSLPLSQSLSPANLERRDALDRLILLIEQQLPGVRASVLVLDDDGTTLRHGGAPNLPEEYCALIDGLKIGPKAGSCGTAIFRGKAVIVEDIASDPLWEDYRAFALPHDLRACWSTPITDDGDKIIGSFAMYYNVPRLPTPPERLLTKTATTLAANIILRARSQAELIDRAGMLEQKSRQLAESEKRERAARAEADHAVESALAFAKLESGRMTYDLENVRVGDLLDDLKALDFERGDVDSNLELKCDRKRTSHILFNLLLSMAKLAPKDGRITVTARRLEGGRGSITVHGSGAEMNPAQIATLFDDESNGLGMIVSKRLACGMGGDISIERPSEGTDFILVLPQ
jgi:GAF domain-containing protein